FFWSAAGRTGVRKKTGCAPRQKCSVTAEGVPRSPSVPSCGPGVSRGEKGDAASYTRCFFCFALHGFKKLPALFPRFPRFHRPKNPGVPQKTASPAFRSPVCYDSRRSLLVEWL